MSSDMSVSKISYTPTIDLFTVKNVLSASNITETQKVQFMRNNSSDIKTLMATKLDGDEYNMLIANRPLMMFKPIKNSFTKRGDKLLLAQTLDIPTKRIDLYIDKFANDLDTGTMNASRDKCSAIKTYTYRHGSKNAVNSFFNYDLSHSLNIKQTLVNTLTYSTGGVADYFARPIHRMDNETFVKLYNTADKNLLKAKEAGQISEAEYNNLSQWALAQIYQIQHNSKFMPALKRTREMSSLKV